MTSQGVVIARGDAVEAIPAAVAWPGLAFTSGVLALLLIVGTLAIGPYPISNDGGSHLYTGVIARDLLGNDGAVFSGFAEVRPWTVPNWGVPLLLWPLLGLGVAAAGKLIVVLCLGLCIGSLYWMARSFGLARDASMALGFVFGNTWFVWAGFWGFALASAMGLATVGWMVRRWKEPRPVDLLVVTTVQVLSVAFHPMPTLFVALAAAGLGLAPVLARRRLGAPEGSWLVAVAVGPALVAGFAFSRDADPTAVSAWTSTGRELLESLVVFPTDAFETWRWPHADGRFAAGIGAVVLAVSAHRRWCQRGVPLLADALLAPALVLMLVRFAVGDAQLRGAFIDARLGYFAWILLMVWAFLQAPPRLAQTALLLMVLSSGIGVALQLHGSTRIAAVMAAVSRDARAAGLTQGTTLVRARFEAGAGEHEAGLDRVRLPYALTHAVDWACAEVGARHITNYELLGTSFAVRGSGLDDSTRALLRSLEEPDRAGHLVALQVILRDLRPDMLALVGTPPSATLELAGRAGYERSPNAIDDAPVVYYTRRDIMASGILRR